VQSIARTFLASMRFWPNQRIIPPAGLQNRATEPCSALQGAAGPTPRMAAVLWHHSAQLRQSPKAQRLASQQGLPLQSVACTVGEWHVLLAHTWDCSWWMDGWSRGSNASAVGDAHLPADKSSQLEKRAGRVWSAATADPTICQHARVEVYGQHVH
jgi:hypothetical protein